jgi:hypothetical protein
MASPGWLALALFLTVGAAPLRAAELDPYLPSDTQMIVSVNVRQLLDSSLVKKYVIPSIKEHLQEVPDVGTTLKDLGFDPLKDLDKVIVTGPGGGADPDRGLVVVYGKFDLAKFKKKGEDAAKDHEDVLKIHNVPDGAKGHFVVYEVVLPNAGDRSLFVSLASDKVMLASAGKDYVVEALKQNKAKKKVVLKNKQFQAMVEKLDPRHGLAVAVVGSALKGDALEEAPQKVRDVVTKIDALGGGIVFGDDVKIDLAIAAKTKKDAIEMRNASRRGLQIGLAGLGFLGGESKEMTALLEILKTIKVSSKEGVVSFKGRITAETVEDLLKKEKEED